MNLDPKRLSMRKAITLAVIIITLSPLIIQNHCFAILFYNSDFYSNEAKYLSPKLGGNIDFEKSFYVFNYDENLSEVKNMTNNGFYRVFDCGNLVMRYKS